MKISILSTFYNDKEMLKRVMDSVLLQTCPNLEHIIVDAASGNGSIQLIQEYEEKYKRSNKILRWISEPDNGIYFGFNKAFDLSTGDYVMVNAPDPYADAHVMSDLLEVLEKEQPDYVYGGMYYQKDGKIIRRWSGKPGNWKLGWMAATPTLCVKRSVMEKYGPFDTNNISADYKFQVRLFMDKSLKSYYLDRIMVIYYAGGISNGGLKANLNSIKDGQRALMDYDIPFGWFITICRIVRALFAYVFASHKRIEIT